MGKQSRVDSALFLFVSDSRGGDKLMSFPTLVFGPMTMDDYLGYIQNHWGQEPWVTVYAFEKTQGGVLALYCALIPNQGVAQSLSDVSWDFQYGWGMPGCSIYHGKGFETVTYHRFGSDNGIEPLVYLREFHGVRPDYVEVSEEFRLFHNLYHDRSSDRYKRFDSVGDEEDIIMVTETRVDIKLQAIKQFLAFKDMHLALFYTIDRYSEQTIAELGGTETDETFRSGLGITTLIIKDGRGFLKGVNTYSRLMGKKLIRGFTREQSGIWPFEESKQYEKFVIGYDQNGKPVSHTCNPDVLSNNFGANPGEPHYLTPVFFKRSVLTKYYNEPERYSVEDGYLRCQGLWGLRLDNNHTDYVVVFLGDLGRDLPYKEQVYWRSFNVPPEGGMSEVYFRRSIMGQFTDPGREDLLFKYTFNRFNSKWEERFGWPLFKPLALDDEHHYKSLRIPLTNDQQEFDQQVLSLAKVLIESINEAEVEKLLPDKKEKERGINKLNRLFLMLGWTSYEEQIDFLKYLWDLREGASHRKGDPYRRAAHHFGVETKPLIEVFEDILRQATELVKYLETRLSQPLATA